MTSREISCFQGGATRTETANLPQKSGSNPEVARRLARGIFLLYLVRQQSETGLDFIVVPSDGYQTWFPRSTQEQTRILQVLEKDEKNCLIWSKYRSKMKKIERVIM